MELTPKKNNHQFSFKLLTPVSKKVTHNKVITNGDRVLLTSMSCDEIWTPVSKGSGIQTTHVAISKFVLPMKRKHSQTLEKSEPSSRKSRRMREGKTNIERVTGSSSFKVFSLLYWLITIAIAVGVYFVLYAKRSWEFPPVKAILQRHLYGQSTAIDDLESAFNYVLSAERASVVVFAGGVGVGKSLTASIILEKFPWPGQAKKITLQQLKGQDLFSVLSIFGWNLLIIEDCKVDIAESDLKLIDTILNHAKLKDIKLFVILVFTVIGDDFDSLNESIAFLQPYRLISFVNLSRDSVVQCFHRDILKMRLEIPDKEIERMIDEQMKVIPQVGGPPGCKQVDMKLIEYIDATTADD